MINEISDRDKPTDGACQRLINSKVGARLSMLYPVALEPMPDAIESALRHCLVVVRRNVRSQRVIWSVTRRFSSPKHRSHPPKPDC
jgi:hypothetical protein